MRAPLRLMPPWPKEQLVRIREIERDFHVRAFGEELARVNLDLTIEDRLRYLAWMRDIARRNRRAAPLPSPRGADQHRCEGNRHDGEVDG